MTPKPGKVTQREIARIAGVSQTTVSMVLNDRDGSNIRIPDATRERVRRAIEQSTYVADPAARRLAGLDNKILGVFTYESALTPESMDFYGPLLNGIERAAESLGCDLLFFTSSPVEEGRRRLFHRQTRLRLADGCVLLGQQMDGDDLERLVAEDFPFVAVGRRDETDAPVPYVGIDYGALTGALLDRAAELGHERILYMHRDRNSPTARDRLAAVARADGPDVALAVVGDDFAGVPGLVAETGATAVFAEDAFLVEDIALALGDEGAGLSLAALAEVRGHRIGGRALSGFHTPRQQIAAEALALLQELISTAPDERGGIEIQRLLQGEVALGDTLTARGGAR
ncbi:MULTISPECIES: LacI family DNA-binding transcriptional regulator [Glycomyces]|uniref:DNA-binding LacI/PurR family transcriptional regulator n=2 Tax=Glycomyces TaxID=58113 RepID=A0A9X3PL86_9ACTN|nr:LacI family DNA-binding transcriptional regulator [Glycomyces lechevalierae]MDA1385984.1 LacI family DNA-binding transcriptional regulator [Glycomyces lechevalierae]MDR7340859.1 DNA-binding LacI/PurR family transcriptional regulator [Glycomyces lechevalierae]